MRWVAENAVAVADELASLRFDHAGSLYHRLLAAAKYDGSFYTNNVSAMLLARLALTEDMVNWSDANALAELKIIDPACGTGHAADGGNARHSRPPRTLGWRGVRFRSIASCPGRGCVVRPRH